jgi:hypothetical protein
VEARAQSAGVEIGTEGVQRVEDLIKELVHRC